MDLISHGNSRPWQLSCVGLFFFCLFCFFPSSPLSKQSRLCIAMMSWSIWSLAGLANRGGFPNKRCTAGRCLQPIGLEFGPCRWLLCSRSAYGGFIVIWRSTMQIFKKNIQITVRLVEMTTINSVRWESCDSQAPTPRIQMTQATSWLKVWQQMW